MTPDKDEQRRTVEKAWLAVVERRSREIREGKVKTIPAEEVHRELKAKYGLVDEGPEET